MVKLKELSNLFSGTKQGKERKQKNLKRFLLCPQGPEASREIPSSGRAAPPPAQTSICCAKATACRKYLKYGVEMAVLDRQSCLSELLGNAILLFHLL